MKLLACMAIIALCFVIISPSKAFAHPGRTGSSGCHYCWTNCGAWGLSYGEYHCH